MRSKRTSVLVLAGIILAAFGLATLSYFGVGRNEIFGIGNIKLGLDLQGGVAITYEADTASPTAEEMASARKLIRDRLDRRGWTEAEESLQGTNRIRVDIPGVENAEEAISAIGRTAQLSFRDEDGNTVVSGNEVTGAYKRAYQDNNGTVVNSVMLEFTSLGQAQFYEATQANIGKRIYIMLDEDAISAPTVQTAINGGAEITGNFTPETAEELAALIRAGSLPFNLTVVNMSNVGAKLGANSLETSLIAGLIGICIVLAFMAFIYRLAGAIADLSLVIYVGLALVLLSLFEITLTLPGIAGIILSIGMAVDANIIILERLKEELRAGKTMRTAIDLAFSKAFSAILDGNVTTLISAAVLFWLGTGPIKGFAQTLALGIIISMFTALVVTKILMKCLLGMGVSNPSLYRMNMREKGEEKEKKALDVIGLRTRAFVFSAVVIVAGFVAMLINGVIGNGMFNYAVEFSGGLSIIADVGQDFNNNDITDIISDVTGQSSPQVQRVTGTNNVSIKIKSIEAEQRIELVDRFEEAYSGFEIELMDDVSATVSGEMQTTAILAVLVACVAMMIYITIRFRDVKLGGSAILATLHNAFIMLTIYAAMRFPLNYSFIAAILTVLGYTINANIVIFDRMRENRKLDEKTGVGELVNVSTQQSMTRAIYTTCTTLFTITAIAVFGVQSVREFSIPIILGIVFGTYASIFIAGSLWYIFCNRSKVSSGKN